MEKEGKGREGGSEGGSNITSETLVSWQLRLILVVKCFSIGSGRCWCTGSILGGRVGSGSGHCRPENLS